MGQLRELTQMRKSPLWRTVAVATVSVGLVGCAQVAPLVRLNPLAQSQQAQTTTDQAQARAQAQSQAPQAVQATVAPTAVASPTVALVPGIRTTTVRRGPISEILLLNGRVAGVDESPLAFSSSGTVSSVYVQAGQSVTAGQALIDADPKQAQKDLASAQAQAQTAADALKKGQDQVAQAQRQANAQRDAAVSDAQSRLRQAQANLDKVRGGASDSDKQAADAAVFSAQTNLDKANAELAKLNAPPDASALRTAQQAVVSAQVALQAAQADQVKLAAPPDAAAVRDAQRVLADAKANLLAAQADLDKLNKGPDPFELRAVQRAVEAAQANLDAVTSAPDSKAAPDTRSQAQRDAASTAAKLALQDAQDKLAKLKQPPDPVTVQLAQSKVDDARAAVASAQDKLDALQIPPDKITTAKAQASVDTAQTTLDNARASLSQLQGGPSPDQLQNAKAAVDAATLALTAAQTKRDEVYGHPTPAELSDAQQAVNTAQQAVSRAQGGDAGPSANGGPNLDALQRAVDDANANVAQMQAALDATHLRAPTDATIAQVLVNAGDIIDPAKAAVVLARSADPVVRVNLLDGDKPKRVEVRQSVKVQVDGTDGQLDGQVASFAEPAANGDRIALLKVNWASARPSVGTGARASITVQQKDNALILPLRAVTSNGTRQTVQTLDGTTRKSIPVQLGIISGTDVEIVSGLNEGDAVVLDSSTDGYQPNARPTPVAAPAASPSPVATVSPQMAETDSSGTAGTATGSPSAPNLIHTLASVAKGPATEALSRIDEWFMNNTRNWPSDPNGTAWIADGAYNLATRKAAQFVAVGIPGSSDLQDATVTANFRKTAGPAGGGYGIVLRAQDASALDGSTQTGRFYVFEAGDEGEFGVWLRDNDKWVDIVPWTSSKSVNTDTASNELSVTANGDQLSFSINGVVVTKQTDTQLQHGAAGIFIGGDGNQVKLEHLSVTAPSVI